MSESGSGARASGFSESTAGVGRHLGLRAQILLALSLAFAGAFALMSSATMRLTERARAVDVRRTAKATVRAFAAALQTTDDAAHIADAIVGSGGVKGVRVDRPSTPAVERGDTSAGDIVEVPLAFGGSVRVWLSAPEPSPTTRLANQLVAYVALTVATVLVFVYLALTYLIVRPIDRVRHAAMRLAAGTLSTQVQVSGAAEVHALASAFNRMADQLYDERRALEARVQELVKKGEELRAAQEQVVRSERLASVGRLASGIAHEIGNPLAAILGFIELVRGGGLEPEMQGEFLRRIQVETERIHGIIRGLLDFARRGQSPPSDARADLSKVVEDAVRLVSPHKDLRNVTLERRLLEETWVRADADQLTQVVLNLLLNSADAIGGEGSIRLEVSPDSDGDWVTLVVADSGPGIAPEVLEHLFEPFVTTKPAGKGTGLGLAVCLTIVERFGGSIRATNPPLGGARFEVRLHAAESKSAGKPRVSR